MQSWATGDIASCIFVNGNDTSGHYVPVFNKRNREIRELGLLDNNRSMEADIVREHLRQTCIVMQSRSSGDCGPDSLRIIHDIWRRLRTQ